MGTQTETAIDRRRRQIAASYRRQGYRVTAAHGRNRDDTALPSFLTGCHPDLIAEKDGDHVVIEVKPARALKGSNDLIKLAERVAAEPGWRLELVTLKSPDNDSLLLGPDWLERMLQPIAPGANDVLTSLYLTAILEYLLRGLALRNDLRLRDKQPSRVAHELAFAGVVDEALLTRITDVLAWRDDLMHGLPTPPSAAEQTNTITTLCHTLHAQLHTLRTE